MSFISVILCEKYMSVMADSRGSEVYIDGRFHKVISENENKINILSSSVFYSITGISEYARDFIKRTTMDRIICDNDGNLVDESKIKKWFNSSIKYMNYSYDFSLSFGGKAKSNEFILYGFESDKKILTVQKSNQNDLKYELSVPNDVSYELVENKFKELYNLYYNGTQSSMKTIQEVLNDYVSDLSQTVNKVKKYFVIT
jgi:DNA primase large subunit